MGQGRSVRGAVALLVPAGMVCALATSHCGGGASSPEGSDAGGDRSSPGDASQGEDAIIVVVDSTAPDVVEHDGGDAGGDVVVVEAEAGVACDAATAIVCSGVCVNEQTDPNNCNGCGNKCPGPEAGTGKGVCVNAACGLSCESDGGTSLLCPSGDCVDPTTISNCGACGTVCPAPTANGTASCGGSPLACGFSCTAGYHAAGGGAACNVTCSPNTDDPSGDPCVIADGLGVFVAPTGSDTAPGDGTKEHPFQTVGHAMDVAETGVKRVYACGTFTQEQLVVGASRDGVTVYGGFSCANWAYSASTQTKMSPVAQGYALEVTGTTTGVTFEDFEFDAQSAPNSPSLTPQSSIAVFANGAKLTLTRVTVTAGAGQPGAGGNTGSNWSGTAPGGGKATLLAGGGGGANTCGDGTTSTGGTGGSFNAAGATSGLENGSDVNPNSGSTNTGSCSVGGPGQPGAGAPTQAGGVTSSGSLLSTGWTLGGTGGAGANGSPAQGGGGGGANDDPSNGGSGGGGGAGGCGGVGGGGGVTGGGSIGILDYESTLVLTNITIVTSLGGPGGPGSPGQAGQGGGTGTIGSGNGAGCSGGNGGAGGGGGGGGGGAGGPSSGVVWKGANPPSINGTSVSNQATLSGITLGGQGAGGQGGSGSLAGTSGLTPTAMAVFQSP